ncbi:MAG: 50S ribosomal protein L21 [Candidatus Aeolococcus gillhamiae]|uniref:Large ribosomal subunit protein bL21 n=1 Tax=Candidatus Aeolococcus gillhamiae TaxID=3127015 RepID=A0A2W6A4T4_9BACT|nr:MAG: 50S ribosomal protein L21 [Candidatus Dormibacter sp. RRmetagenome_bin12]
MYAILSHGGRQYRVSAGDRLVVDRLDAEVGSVVGLEPVLLTGGDGTTAVGKDVDGLRVAVTVIAHRRGEKLRIFKYKAKKRSRKAAGYRSDLTELRVESILARGATLPRPSTARSSRSAETSASAPSEPAPKAQRRSAATASATGVSTATAKPAPKAAGAALKTATKPKAKASTKAAGDAKPAPKRTGTSSRAKETNDGA